MTTEVRGMAATPTRSEGAALIATPLDAYEPRNVAEAQTLATWLVKSRLLGTAVQNEYQALAIMVAGRELGLRQMQALRSIHIIDGKPTLAADLMLALCIRAPECRFFRMVESTSERATYETLRASYPEATRYTFTAEMAKRAQLLAKSNWQKYPEAMLRARCITALARMVYPDLFMGVYDPDELPLARPQAAPAGTVIEVQANGSGEVVAPEPPVAEEAPAVEQTQPHPIPPVKAWEQAVMALRMAHPADKLSIAQEFSLGEQVTANAIRKLGEERCAEMVQVAEALAASRQADLDAIPFT